MLWPSVTGRLNLHLEQVLNEGYIHVTLLTALSLSADNYHGRCRGGRTVMLTIPALTSTRSLAELRDELRVRTAQGSSALLGGILLRTGFGILGLVLPQGSTRRSPTLLGGGLLFPLSLVIARFRRLDPVAAGNPLGVLAGLLGAVQVLYIPVMLGAYFRLPAGVRGSSAYWSERTYCHSRGSTADGATWLHRPERPLARA